jgi:hypothetical protein
MVSYTLFKLNAKTPPDIWLDYVDDSYHHHHHYFHGLGHALPVSSS